MITEINNLEDYHTTWKEWRDILEMNTKEYFSSEEQRHLAFLDEIMGRWAYSLDH
jgi:hypothetical protein